MLATRTAKGSRRGSPRNLEVRVGGSTATGLAAVRRTLPRDRDERRAGRPGQAQRDPSGPRRPGGRGAPPDRGRPGRRQDHAREGHRTIDRLLVPPDPVHPGPAPHRRHRRERLQPGARDFEFKPGAIFANIVLGDEINRASPKTQSALLECMEERQVTVDTETHPLGTPFMVIATQNPIEHEGTYPLPEAQLDRFMLRLSIGYPTADIEVEILSSHSSGTPLTDIGPVNDAPRRRGDDRRGATRPRRAGDPPLHRRPGGSHAAPLGHVPGREPARLDHDPAGLQGDGRRRRTRLRDPRRREGARHPGARPPDHRDGGRRHERPVSTGRPGRRSLREVPVPVAENP